MAYTTNDLIAGAYYAAGVVSREFETVSGSQYSDGLQWVNEILADKDVDQAMVPYESKYYFNSQAGVESYFIPNLIQIDTLVFYLNSVRYSMTYTPRNAYFGSSRVENIQTLPFQWYWERKTNGGILYIYFKPDQNYPLEIRGIFRLNDLKLTQDLESNQTIANLGKPTFYTGGDLNLGQLLINDYDMEGVYPNIGSFVNKINTGFIPGVKAKVSNLGDVILYSDLNNPVIITIKTTGYQPNGTSFISNVAAATVAPLPSNTYNNGVDGVGATLIANANGALSVDGYAVALNDRVLIKNQLNELENGLYIVTQTGSGIQPFILTRTTNYDKSYQIAEGTFFKVLNGTINANSCWLQNAQVGVIGVDPIAFTIFSALTFENFSTIEQADIETFVSLGVDKFYITYLRYALADRICAEYNYVVPAKIVEQLKTYESWIRKKSRILDLRMEKLSTLTNRANIGWGWVNLGKGWLPPS